MDVHGTDGVLILIACLLFLLAVPAAWIGHRAALSLVALGLFLWALTGIVT